MSLLVRTACLKFHGAALWLGLALQALALPQLEQTPTTQHLIGDKQKRNVIQRRHPRLCAEPRMQPAGKGRHLLLLHAPVLQDCRVVPARGLGRQRQRLPAQLQVYCSIGNFNFMIKEGGGRGQALSARPMASTSSSLARISPVSGATTAREASMPAS